MFSRDVVRLTKESVQDLESFISRTSVDVDSYVVSRKKINKMISKFTKNLKSFNHKSTETPSDLKAIGSMLKETEALGLSILKSALMLVSGSKERSKQRSWSLLSKFAQTSRVHSEVEQEEDLRSLNIKKSKKGLENITLEQLKASEMTIQELEALFRNLVKSSVSLLNVLCS